MGFLRSKVKGAALREGLLTMGSSAESQSNVGPHVVRQNKYTTECVLLMIDTLFYIFLLFLCYVLCLHEWKCT